MIWYDEIIFFKLFFCFYYSQFHFGFHVAVLAIEDFFRLESWVFLLRSLCQFYLGLPFFDVGWVCLLCSIFANLFSVFNVVGCRTFFDRIRSLLRTPQTELVIQVRLKHCIWMKSFPCGAIQNNRIVIMKSPLFCVRF